MSHLLKLHVRKQKLAGHSHSMAAAKADVFRRLSAPPAPRMSDAPWAGFTSDDVPRLTELQRCPSRKCFRAKACIDAHLGLYCQRTHLGPREAKRHEARYLPEDPATLPPPVNPDDIDEQMDRVKALTAIRVAQHKELTERWKSGEFDALYGPYKARGIMVGAPPKVYRE